MTVLEKERCGPALQLCEALPQRAALPQQHKGKQTGCEIHSRAEFQPNKLGEE